MITFSVFSGLIGVPAFFGNLLVLLVLALNKNLHLMRYFYLASLAFSDLLFTSIVLSFRAVSTARNHKEQIFGSTCCNTLAYITEVLRFTAVLHLCAVSHERYLAIVKEHLTYNGLITARKLIFAILLLWILPLAIFAGPFFGFGAYEYHSKIFACTLRLDHQGTLGIVVLTFIAPLVFISVLNYNVLKIVRRLKRQIIPYCAGEGKTDSMQEPKEIQTGGNRRLLTAANIQEPLGPALKVDGYHDSGHGATTQTPTEQVLHCSQLSADGTIWSPKEGARAKTRTDAVHLANLQRKLPNISVTGFKHGRRVSPYMDQLDVPKESHPSCEGKAHGANNPKIRKMSCASRRLAGYQQQACEDVGPRKPIEPRSQSRCLKQFFKTLKECKAEWDVMFIIGAFMLSYLPYCIVTLFTVLGMEPSSEILLAVHSAFATSAVWNPIIYSIRKREFRRAVKKLAVHCSLNGCISSKTNAN